VISIQEVAERLNLSPAKSKGLLEYQGKNPWGEGAVDDGFSLFGEGPYAGMARDRHSGQRYTSSEIAKRAGIPYEEYEAFSTQPAGQGTGGRGRGLEVVKTYSMNGHHSMNGHINGNILTPNPLSPTPKEYDTRDLRGEPPKGRGLTMAAQNHFRIGYCPGGGGDKDWGPYFIFPAHNPDGTVATTRKKFVDPNIQLDRGRSKACKTLSEKGKANPVGYNLNAINHKTRDVWLVNSELAVWLWWQEGLTAIAPLGEGGSLERYRKMISYCADNGMDSLNILLDNDAAGRAASVVAYDVAASIPGLKVTVYDLSLAPDGTDASDLWERWKLDRDAPKKFLNYLTEQAIAAPSTLDFWRTGSKIAAKKIAGQQRLQRIEQASEVIERVTDQASRLVSSTNDKADELLKMVHAVGFFNDDTGKQYVKVQKDDKKDVVYEIGSTSFMRWLRYVQMRDRGVMWGESRVKEVQESLRSWCQEVGEVVPSFVRSAYVKDDKEIKVYIDLCDEFGRVAEITRHGWKIVTETPEGIFFRRGIGEESMPVPVANPKGNEDTWQKFREIINIGNDANWILYLSWMITAIMPPEIVGSCPILAISGEQGSGKTWMARFARDTIDPNKAGLLEHVRKEDELVISAESLRAIALDNQSRISESLSDLLCAMVTGNAMRVRALYTNDEERIFNARPAFVMAGITPSLGGLDLADRSIRIEVPPILKGHKDELIVQNRWRKLWPRLVYAIFDAIVCGLANRERIEEETKETFFPRMSSYVKWVMCCEEEIRHELHTGMWMPGLHYEIMMLNVKKRVESDTMDLLGMSLRRVLARGDWAGPSSQLYNDCLREAIEISIDQTLKAEYEEGHNALGLRKLVDDTRKSILDSKSFPGDERWFGKKLSLMIPALRGTGIHAVRSRNSAGNYWTISNVGDVTIIRNDAVELGDPMLSQMSLERLEE
jgi:hypothetical protein